MIQMQSFKFDLLLKNARDDFLITLLLLCKVSYYFFVPGTFSWSSIFWEKWVLSISKKHQETLSGKDAQERSHPGQSSLPDNREHVL